MLNDLFIFKKIKDGDIKTFEYVFRQYYSPLYIYSFSIVGKKEAAEEIVQELFYTLWKERENIQILRSLKSYLYGAVRNQSLQYYEHQNVQSRYRETVLSRKDDIEESSPLDELEYKELQDLINKTLKKLPARRLRIFQMHRMEGRKYKEIAEILSVSVKTVEAEMTKTYQVLRHEVEKYTHAL
ncbi:RNA polymerase sigma-70 factor [Dysgonomonas sp. ZJ279]|uniref:RNA polymerase sigma-70 factor n=1 Tax=Dysgonomonas sp. ZJ279 TaxID=2709796 RepID=UPI0013EAC8F8|nr:RNA polymerase sigma-70 factor [Dysgonomonas sp. ZJ279]